MVNKRASHPSLPIPFFVARGCKRELMGYSPTEGEHSHAAKVILIAISFITSPIARVLIVRSRKNVSYCGPRLYGSLIKTKVTWKCIPLFIIFIEYLTSSRFRASKTESHYQHFGEGLQRILSRTKSDFPFSARLTSSSLLRI